jgi:putative ABC transport system ATP-binding protein
MLDVQGLLIQRGEGLRVHVPRLHLARGAVLAVTGESGCGKSTLLETLGLLLAPQAVERFCLGPEKLDVAAMLAANDQAGLAATRSRQLGFILQSGGLLPFLSVRDNISLPRRLLGMPVRSERVEHAVDVLRLAPLLGKLPQMLSIGERQRAACVRAIAHEPLLLLADEPTAALDPHNARRLFELLLGLVSDLGLSALVVSHDWTLVRDFALPRLSAQSGEGETRFELMD